MKDAKDAAHAIGKNPQDEKHSAGSLQKVFSEIYLNYIRTAQEGQIASRKRYSEFYYQYNNALQQQQQELQKRYAKAYQIWLGARQEVRGGENPQQGIEDAYRHYLAEVQEGQEVARKQGEKEYMDCQTRLQEVQQESYKLFRNAFVQYVQSLKDVWARLDVNAVAEYVFRGR